MQKSQSRFRKHLAFFVVLGLTVAGLTRIVISGDPLPIPQIEWNPKTYVCYQTPEPIEIDGRLDDPAWSKTEWTDDFIDIQGTAKPQPPYRTRVKMLWDEHYFYVAAELDEPDVWATLTQRDTVIFYDNDFFLYFACINGFYNIDYFFYCFFLIINRN